MEITGTLILITLIAALASFLTFFSGFGLGTILLPVFSIFFPIEVAVMATAIVHFLNNIFKSLLVFKHADRAIVLRFGSISILGALVGAWVFSMMDSESLRHYTIGSLNFDMNMTGLVIGTFLLIFSFIELIPAGKNMQFGKEYQVPGGFVSGFFGGLSGHQGALRTAFLARAGLTKEAFVASGVLIACMVDVTRIPIYLHKLSGTFQWSDSLFLSTLICSCLGAVTGALIGNYALKKTSYSFIRGVVSVFLLLMGIFMIMGVQW